MMEREEKQNSGLPEGWNLRTIESLGEIVTGSTPRTNNSDFWDGEYLFITPSDITDSLFVKSTERKVTSLGLNIGRSIPEGTVLVTCIGSIGKMAISNVKIAITNQQINSIVCNNTCNNYFVYYLLKAFKDVLFENASQTTLPIINKSNFLKLKLPFPQINEQKRIVAILYKIQQAIEVQDEIIKKTKELKKSTMQFLFTRGVYGGKTKLTEIGEMPEGWEVKQIKEVIVKTEQINPLQLSTEKFEYIDVSSVSKESLKIVETTSTLKANAPGRARKLVKIGDVIIATVRPTLKRLAFIEKEYDNQICSTAFCVLRSNPNLMQDKFLFYIMQQDYIYKILETMQGGASYPAVTDKNIYSLSISLPKKEEQSKISKILSDIDRKIELVERKRQTLNNLFQSMLNKLMTGGICVKDIKPWNTILTFIIGGR